MGISQFNKNKDVPVNDEVIIDETAEGSETTEDTDVTEEVDGSVQCPSKLTLRLNPEWPPFQIWTCKYHLVSIQYIQCPLNVLIVLSVY